VRRPVVALLVLAVAVPGCAGKRKPQASILPADEAYLRGMELIARRDLREAIEALQSIQYSPQTLQDTEPLARLALADATFYQDTDLALIDARNLYLDFVTLYGDHALAPYAQTQAGLCSLKQVNRPTRDQSQTHQAIGDLQVVIERYRDSPFARAARGLLADTRSHLAESEFLVGQFYLKRKAWAAAAERFRLVIERYPDYAALDKVLFHLGRALVAGSGDVEGRLYLDQLITEYPDSPWADDARRLLAESADDGHVVAGAPG
jgi:outer membrane protein assembly factor BamD